MCGWGWRLLYTWGVRWVGGWVGGRVWLHVCELWVFSVCVCVCVHACGCVCMRVRACLCDCVHVCGTLTETFVRPVPLTYSGTLPAAMSRA